MRRAVLLAGYLVSACVGRARPTPGLSSRTVHQVYRLQDSPLADASSRSSPLTGFVDAQGVRWPAGTKWRYRWSVPTTPTGQPDCLAARSARVWIRITTILPKWPEHHRASGSDQRAWLTYRQALQEHEAQHQQLAHQFAETLHGELRSMLSADPCPSRALVAERARAVTQEHLDAQERLDRTTRHGPAHPAKDGTR